MVENSIDDIEQRRVKLRSFLRAARERVRPEEHCLPSRTRRRTPGLRREDVAELAGVSTAWYTLLETARNRRVSTRMLDRVANALMLSDAEKLQLYSLAFPEIPSLASTDSSAAASGGESEDLRAYLRTLRASSTKREAAQAAIDFLWNSAGPCDLAAYLEQSGDSNGYVCVASRSIFPDSSPPDGSVYRLGGAFDHAFDFGITILERDLANSDNMLARERASKYGAGRSLGVCVDAAGRHGVLVYMERALQPHGGREQDLLLIARDALELAIARRHPPGNVLHSLGGGARPDQGIDQFHDLTRHIAINCVHFDAPSA